MLILLVAMGFKDVNFYCASLLLIFSASEILFFSASDQKRVYLHELRVLDFCESLTYNTAVFLRLPSLPHE